MKSAAVAIATAVVIINIKGLSASNSKVVFIIAIRMKKSDRQWYPHTVITKTCRTIIRPNRVKRGIKKMLPVPEDHLEDR